MGRRRAGGPAPRAGDRELLSRIAKASGGDARVALTALEAAVEATEPDKKGTRVVKEETVVEALGRAQYDALQVSATRRL